jgi:cell division protein FtsB
MRYFAALSILIILTITFTPLISSAEAPLTQEERIDRLEKKLKKLQKENKRIKKSIKSATHSEKVEIKDITKQQKTFDKLKARTEELQELLEEVESESLDAQDSLISDLVKISGYADAELRITSNKNDNNSFRIRHLSLFFSKRVQEKWKFFSEIEFEDAPYVESVHVTDDADTVQGKILVEQVYIEYQPQLGMELRFGRFLTPAGIWNIFHYYPYVPTQTRPIFVRRIFPSYSDGIQVRRAFNMADTMFDAHLYISNGSGNPGKLDRNNEKAIGARLNFSRDLLDGMEAGFSYYRDTEKDSVTTIRSVRNSFAAHLKLAHEDFKLQAEYAIRDNSPDGGSDFKDAGLYTQLSYDIKKWTLAGRYDWYDLNDTISDNDQVRYTAAVNYHLAHNVIGKIEYNINEYEDPLEEDYNELITSIVIAIGDL